MRTRIILSLLTAGLLSATAYAQGVNTGKLDSLFSVLEAKNKAMGSIAISKNGKLQYTRAIGNSLLKEGGNIKASTDTRYRIGSITKMFTATMIFQLAEEKKIDLNTKLDKYFPELPNAGKITISNLLGHRSGLHNFTNDAGYTEWMEQPKSEKEMLDIIAKGGTDFEPDSKAEYSNSNYVLLGYIIEKASGKPYAALLKEKIAGKAGLKHTYYGKKSNIKEGESLSYQWISNWMPQPETDMSIPHGAGAIVSTPGDLTRFADALFKGKLISKASLAQMTEIKDNYGKGIFMIPFGEKKGFGHTGGIDGFSAMLIYFPQDSTAIAYCSNGTVYPVNDIMIGALSIYYNQPYAMPDFNTIAVDQATLDLYTGIYASAQIPVKITISRNGNTLMAQATGQSSFPLEATKKDKFKFDAAGIEIDFDQEKKELVLKQGGGSFTFTKEP
jgi:D-alanyl-D-alanine carboxypeptidase